MNTRSEQKPNKFLTQACVNRTSSGVQCSWEDKANLAPRHKVDGRMVILPTMNQLLMNVLSGKLAQHQRNMSVQPMLIQS
jgi:hypothetical protein